MEDNALERIAEDLGGHEVSQDHLLEHPDIPRCPGCHRPLDDIETMDEAALLGQLRLGALRMLARNLREGQMTHQELAVLRGLLRDNGTALQTLQPEEPGEDAALPSQGRTRIPTRRPRPDYGGTEG